jgi:DNA-binding NarL/FixJ family response regulator
MTAPRTLLLLEGHPLVRGALADRLRRHPAVGNVIVAACLADALELIAQCKPDVVICDPRSIGQDAHTCVRQLHGAGVPVLVLTSSLQHDEIAAFQREGASDVVLKGGGIAVVIRSIEQLLLRRAPVGC